MRHSRRSVLIDFGVAALIHRARGVAGTPGFISPEELVVNPGSAGSDPAIDIFRAGVTLYFAATGDMPWPYVPEPARARVVMRNLPSFEALARSQSAAIDRMLEAADRASARELLAEIQSSLPSSSSRAAASSGGGGEPARSTAAGVVGGSGGVQGSSASRSDQMSAQAPAPAAPRGNGTRAVKPSSRVKSFWTTWWLSACLGLFGIDRMYLGQWGTGVLKLLTGGGVVVWAAMDLMHTTRRKRRDRSGRVLQPAEGQEVGWLLPGTWVVIAVNVAFFLYAVLTRGTGA